MNVKEVTLSETSFKKQVPKTYYLYPHAYHSLFIYKKKSKVFISILLYIDDTIIMGNYLNKIEEAKVFLDKQFNIKDFVP